MRQANRQPNPVTNVPIGAHDATTHSPKRLEYADTGHQTVLAKIGQPRALVAPSMSVNANRKCGQLKGRVEAAFFEPLPECELNRWTPVFPTRVIW